MTTAEPNHLKFPECLFFRRVARFSSSKPAELTKGSSVVEAPPKLWWVREIAVCLVQMWVTIRAITTSQARSQYSRSFYILLWGQGAQRLAVACLFQCKSNPFQCYFLLFPVETKELKRNTQASSVKATILKMTNLVNGFVYDLENWLRLKKKLTIFSFVLGGKFNHG